MSPLPLSNPTIQKVITVVNCPGAQIEEPARNSLLFDAAMWAGFLD